MDIFDIKKDDLLKLDASQLEELIARLAEAVLASKGFSPADVYGSGSMTAADGGIDVHVQVPVEKLDNGFLRRPDTVFQVKKSKMPPSKITEEMRPGGKLLSAIVNQASRKGSYIIVSLEDNCSSPEREKRLNAMKDAVSDDPNKSDLHLDFYDRSKLQQWLRQHPSVMLWVKEQLGEGYSGWRPYGAWSNPPKWVDDRLILAPGITITLPSGKREKRSLKDAIEPMRDLIKNTKKAVRIIGLSGVGKTRIVQALFDETIGSNALDRTVAVYADVGDEIKPPATEMLDKLIAKKQQAIIILDNCSSELHSSLARKASAAGDMVKLITIEYDIREDKPQTTDVIRIEAVGSGVAEELLLRRFPDIGHNNACRIAEFANGNTRVSLAIAERVEEGESLAQLSDDQLFNRLFVQRHDPYDDNLRKQAEILSLVYSFSFDDSDENQNELEILGSIWSYSRDELYRSVNTLFERGIVQKRGNWRAILPQVIANKLAVTALNSIPVKKLRATFEAPNRQRLLMSFAHRLGLLHDQPVAKQLVERWLQPGELLSQLFEVGNLPGQLLSYIAPVTPELLLNWIEKLFTKNELEDQKQYLDWKKKLFAENYTEDLEQYYDWAEKFYTENNIKDQKYNSNPIWETIPDLLLSIAYEQHTFERSTKLLIQMADYEEYISACSKVKFFFQAYLSGTHASIEDRIALMDECINSENKRISLLGLDMFSTALKSSDWIGWNYEFGAQSRDYGFEPNPNELVEWYSAFIDVAVSLGNSGNNYFEQRARSILAENFRELWHQETLRNKLIEAAHKLNDYCHWEEGWNAICLINVGSDRFKLEPDKLAALKKKLEPNELIPKIKTYVLSEIKYQETEALQLGQNFALSQHKLNDLGDRLFFPYKNDEKIIAFGKGLVKGADDIQISWQQLVKQLEKYLFNTNYSFFKSYIEDVHAKNTKLAQQLLDACVDHPDVFVANYSVFKDFIEEVNAKGVTLAQQLFDACVDHPKVFVANYSVFKGFIEEVNAKDVALAQKLLDQCADHPILKQVLVDLYPWSSFTEKDLDRCIKILNEPGINPFMYSKILWQDHYSHLPKECLQYIASQLLKKSEGEIAVLNALSRKLRSSSLDPEFHLIGLTAAIQMVEKINSDQNSLQWRTWDKKLDIYSKMECVIYAALRFNGNEAEKMNWLDAVFSIADNHYNSYMLKESIKTTAALMPEAFLNRVFKCSAEYQKRIGYDSLDRVDVEKLIKWCKTKNDPKAWEVAAAGISLWSEVPCINLSTEILSLDLSSGNANNKHWLNGYEINPTSGKVSIKVCSGKDGIDYWMETGIDLRSVNSEQIQHSPLKLLEASPYPKVVLMSFANRIGPKSWFGSKGDIMQRRVDAIGELINHERADISEAAKEVYNLLIKQVEYEKKHETLMNQEPEQWFE